MVATQRTAEIVGAGFAGLATAVALANRGWKVRVHERAAQLRTAGAGIYIYENGLRVLEALGIYDEVIANAFRGRIRELRNEKNLVVSRIEWPDDGPMRCSRLYVRTSSMHWHVQRKAKVYRSRRILLQ